MADDDQGGSQAGGDGQHPDGGDGGQQRTEQQQGREQKQTPPWGSDEQFDPAKAWALIQNVRADLDKVKGQRDELKIKTDEHERGKLSDTEKLTADRDGYKTRAEKAEGQLLRMEVAAAKGLTPAQAKRLQGSSKEELEADADDLVSTFAAATTAASGPPTNRPREQYRGGTSDPGETPTESDPAKLAAAIRAAGPGHR